MLAELSDLPVRNINNFSFNGAFKNIESVTSFLDCLGSHFTWLQVIFTNFPALLNFVSKLKCVTGLCPKDLEDYGCACRYEMEGLPIDAADSCCFQHRKCYEEALEMDCTWDPAKIIADVSCLTKSLTCESGNDCEKLLCNCDKAAIECFVNTHINSSLKGLDITFCPAPVTVTPETTFQNGEVMLDSKSEKNRSVYAFYGATQEGERNSLQNDMTALPDAEDMTATPQSPTSPPSTPAVESSGAGSERPKGTLKMEAGSERPEGTPKMEAGSERPEGTPKMEAGSERPEGTTKMEAGSERPEGTPKMEDPSSRDAAISITESPSEVLNNLLPSVQSTSRPLNAGPTKSGFKNVEESTLRSALSPLSAATELESVEQVCDRFHFQRVKEDGDVKSDLPLLGEMLYCLTGRCPEEFETYGCYCGQEGTGNPKDVLDSCCFSHHCCIDHLRKLGCVADRNIRSEVVCVDHKPTCVGWSICDKLACTCDTVAAECMAAAPFNGTMRSLHRRQCLGVSLLCRNAGVGAIGQQSDSSSSEDSSEEHSPMRDIVRAADSAALVPTGGRRSRSILLGN